MDTGACEQSERGDESGNITSIIYGKSLYASILHLDNVPGVSITPADGNKSSAALGAASCSNCRPDNLVVCHSNIVVVIPTINDHELLPPTPVTQDYLNKHVIEYKTAISSKHYKSVMKCRWKYDAEVNSEPRNFDCGVTLSEHIITLAMQPTHVDGNNVPEDLSIGCNRQMAEEMD